MKRLFYSQASDITTLPMVPCPSLTPKIGSVHPLDAPDQSKLGGASHTAPLSKALVASLGRCNKGLSLLVIKGDSPFL